MATQLKKPRQPANKPANKYPNGWPVLGMFIEGVFGLFNTNKIYPAIAMMCFLLAGFIVWRMPANEITPLIRWIITRLGSSTGGVVGLISITNLGWLAIYVRRTRLDRTEIERLSSLRHELMHMEAPRSLTHHSSEAPQKEAYIVPIKATKRVARGEKK